MKEFIFMSLAIFCGGSGIFLIYGSVMLIHATITKTLP